MKTINNIDATLDLPSLVVYLLGRRITPITVTGIIDAIHNACKLKKKVTIAHYNVHGFNLSMQLPWFYEFLQSSDIVHCDGSGILKALSYMGLDLPIQYRVSYTNLIPELLKFCNQQGLSIFLLGSKPEYLDKAINNLATKYPNIKLAGHDGYFSIDDPDINDSIIRSINQIKPNILLLGMGMPLQENWVYRYKDRLDVNAIMVGGAVIDRLAGVVSDCPDFLAKNNLEWLYRLIREPRRLGARYLLGNPAFACHIALAKLYQLREGVTQLESSNYYSWKSHGFTKVVAQANTTPTKKLSDSLVEAGLLSNNDIDIALSEQRKTGVPLREILINKGWIKQETVDFILKNIVLTNQNNSPTKEILNGVYSES
ncbi:WecB/TagA/CpsF family glycosyltransferase [Tolypothrix sp. FACHB-123]|uniref:WecB/TagA/CpsF family glycosyltransferase n=1 Tax=Tolypothrix sp. FACHB-123 TaxID=2692868 RepID=UPI0016820046|nr:WecB/TagA/CpsF family glycosyltransferase [Tolypothrix sp. FACHB-123]MBD2358951.1 WecB/TagA/CpsF family glycosyltransferase [Tolypothrix sp. FACHB-123]